MSAVLDLVRKVKETDAAKSADTYSRYSKLVLRVARGEERAPDSILTALTALDKNPAVFATDVERVAERIELKGVADQLAARAAATRAAVAKVSGIQAEYLAETEKLRERFAIQENQAQAEADAAGAAEREATAARARLVEGCQDAELRERLAVIAAERGSLSSKENAIREGIGTADNLASEAASVRSRNVHPADVAHHNRVAELAKKDAAAAPERMAAIAARRAELDAEAATLEPRLLEPWPVGAAVRG